MNDNDIIKLMKVCSTASGCRSCPLADSTDCAGEVSSLALDIINRLKAESERLEAYNANLEVANSHITNTLWDEVVKAKTEAIKEFAERLKNNIDLYRYVEEHYVNAEFYCKVRQDRFNDEIDNLVKEMTSKENKE